MSGPHSLRLCCLAAMAPALTEATAQSTRMKLPGSPTQPNTPVRNGRDQPQVVQTNGTVGRSLSTKTTRIPHLSHLSGQLSVNANGTPGVKTSTISAARVNIKKTVQDRGIFSSCSSSLLQIASTNGRTPSDLGGRMNQPAPPNENKPGKDLSARSPPPTTSRTHTQLSSTFVNGKGGLHQTKESKPRISNAMGQKNYIGAMAPMLSAKNLAASSGDCCDTRDQPKTDQVNCVRPSMLLDAESNFQRLEKKHKQLKIRLRRLQGKHVARHISQQMTQYAEFQQKNVQTVAKIACSTSTESASPPSAQDFRSDFFQSDKVRNLSTAALVNLVQVLQANNSFNTQRASSTPKPETASVLTIDSGVRRESQLTTDHLQSCLHHARCAVDSDATESSSGGESCDEDDWEVPKDKKFQLALLHRRAQWKWLKERAAVVARWTWLQAQVSDLEYRIRQQGDIHRQTRTNKGPILLEDPVEQLPRHALHGGARAGAPTAARPEGSGEVSASSSQTSVNTMLSNVAKQASQLTQSLGNCVSPGANSLKAVTPSPTRALNGVIDSPTSNSSEVGHGEPARVAGLDSPVSLLDTQDSSTCRAARCLPVGPFKKRRLLRTGGLHLTHAKAARLSTVRCHCYPPVTPCPMCGGRYNNTRSVDQDMPLHERVAILDPSFHPVLSFPQDIPLGVHFEAMLKTGEWQNKPQSRRPRTESDKRRQKVSQINGENRKVPRGIRKNPTAAYLSSQKIRNKYENKAGRKASGGARASAPTQQLKRRRALMVNRQNKVAYLGSLSNAGSRSGTPLPSPNNTLSMSCPASALKDVPVRRRRGESTFDINNIVIPYSIASTAKVEQLNYKPIVIPKWRDLTVENACQEEEEATPPAPEAERESPVPMEVDPAEDEEVSSDEDISDAAYHRRHQKCEEEEKSRFMPQVHSTARRGRMRMESHFPAKELASQDARLMAELDVMPLTPEAPPVTPGMSSALAAHLQGTPPSPRPSSPVMPMDESSQDRRRSFSICRRERGSMQSLDEQGEGWLEQDLNKREPFSLRTFPLSDEEYDEMRRVQPPLVEVPRPVDRAGVQVECRSDSTPSSSHPCSPMPSSASNSMVGDDPNDPEWTGTGSEKTPRKVAGSKR